MGDKMRAVLRALGPTLTTTVPVTKTITNFYIQSILMRTYLHNLNYMLLSGYPSNFNKHEADSQKYQGHWLSRGFGCNYSRQVRWGLLTHADAMGALNSL